MHEASTLGTLRQCAVKTALNKLLPSSGFVRDARNRSSNAVRCSILYRDSHNFSCFLSSNVNGRGIPPAIRACLLGEGTLVHQYIDSLKLMMSESRWLASGPKAVMHVAKGCKVGEGSQSFDHIQFIKGQLDRTHEQHVRQYFCQLDKF